MNNVHPLLRPLLFAAMIVFGSESFALSVCLYARSNNGPASGHSFVTIESNGRVTETYGLWPDSKHRGMLAINKESDLPRAVLIARRGNTLTDTFLKLKEARLCQDLKFSVEQVRAAAQTYMDVYGPYKTMSNNCNHFAVRIYNTASGDTFKVVQTPLDARKLINKITAAKASSYAQAHAAGLLD